MAGGVVGPGAAREGSFQQVRQAPDTVSGEQRAEDDDNATHGRRAALGQVRLRPVLADRLALALLAAQDIDQGAAKQKAKHQRR